MCIHFSGKWPKGWFLASDKAKNHTNEAKKKKKGRIARVHEEKEMRRRNEKSNGCTFSFYIWLRCSFGQKENCLTEEVYLDQVTFKKLQLDIQLKFNFAHKVLTRAKYCYFFMCKPGKVLSCSPGSQLMKITALFLVIFCSSENTLVTRGKSCIRRRTVRCKPHI